MTNTPHAAIWVPFGLAVVTELGDVFGKFDFAKLPPRIAGLLLAGATALSAYLTSNPAASGWRYAPIALAVLFSLKKAIGGVTPGPAKLALVFFLGLSSVTGCAAVISNLPTVISVVQGASNALDMIAGFLDGLAPPLAPEPEKQKLISAAILKARIALDAVIKLSNGVQNIDQAKLDEAFGNFEAAYNDVLSLVAQYGVRSGNVPRAVRMTDGGVVVLVLPPLSRPQ
jgi:hypothetical protein